MDKRCILCKERAAYVIKGTSDAYCEECATESFNDLSLLQTVEEEALQLKQLIKDKVPTQDEEDNFDVEEDSKPNENNSEE